MRNKNGWGLKAMIYYMIALLIFFLIGLYFLNMLYQGIK